MQYIMRVKAGNYATLDMLLAAGGDVNLATKDGTLAMIMVMQSPVNMKEMFYVMVKHGVNLDCFDLKGLESIAGESIDPESVDLVKSVLHADSMLGLRDESPLKGNAADINIVGARLTYYINHLAEKLGHSTDEVVKVRELLATTCPDWQIEEIEQSLVSMQSIDWAVIKKLNSDQIEIVINDYLAGNTPVMPEMFDSAEKIEEKEDSATTSTEGPKKQPLSSIDSLRKLLVIIKKGFGVEAVKKEFAEQEELFVKMYKSFTKTENVDSLLKLYELNHTEEMITAELSGDVGGFS